MSAVKQGGLWLNYPVCMDFIVQYQPQNKFFHCLYLVGLPERGQIAAAQRMSIVFDGKCERTGRFKPKLCTEFST
jgi:hypothetical protein